MADLKLAIKLEADGTALVGGVRLSRDELRKLGEDAKQAANDLGRMGDNVVSFSDTQRQQLRGLLDTLHPAAARARDLQQSIALLDQAQKAGEISTRQHAAAVAELHHQHLAANDSAAGLHGTIGNLTAGFQALGAIIAVDRLVSFGRAAIQAAAESEQLDRRLKSLVGTGSALQDTQGWLGKTADKLGTSLAEMSDGYARFLTLAKGGLVTVQQARDLTVGLRDAQAHFVADAGRMGDVMYGLGQALASPIVHMEELNQVTEPLPGLLLDLDKAAGLPAGGFRRMVNEGKVTSELFRDTLIKALKSYQGEAEKAASGIEGAWARLENARKRFLTEVGKQALPGAKTSTDLLTDGLDLGTRFIQWTKRGEQTASQLYGRQQFDALLAEREAQERALARARAGAGGVYAGRNVALAEQEIGRINAQLDELVRRTNAVEQATASNDGWAEMWGVAGDGINYTASAAEKLAGPLAIVADQLDLIPGKAGLVSKAQAELATHMGTLAKVAALPPEELKKLGLTSADVALMMDRLREKIDPVTKAIADLNRESAALGVKAGWRRELYQALDKAQEEKGRPLTDEEAIGVTEGVRRNQSAKAGDRVDSMKQEADASARLAAARASGSQAAVVAAQAENAYHAELDRSGDKTKATAAKAEVLRKGMADLAGDVGAQVNQTSRSARQMEALAAAYALGGDAVAAVELANRIETETAKVGAGAHSALAQAITAEEAARRKLMAAQFDRDMVLQTAAAKALALAERDGAKAVADAQVANAAAIQIEKEGVATDSARAEAIRAKIAEQAKWQEQQGYERALRDKSDELKLAELELSLQGQGETIRARTLELARAELEIRRQFPNKTDEEVAALLRKHDAVLRIREQIQQQRGIWDEVARLGERAFDRIGEAVTQAFVEGKIAAVDWGSVSRAVMSEVIQAALQLAAINPLKNWATGGNAPTLWSAMSGGGQSGGAQTGSLYNGSTSQMLSAGNSLYNIGTGTNMLGNAAYNFAMSSYGTSLGLSAAGSGTALTGGIAGMTSGSGAVTGLSANAAGVQGLMQSSSVTGLSSTGASTVGTMGAIGAAAPYGFLGGMGGAYLSNQFMGGSKVGAGLTGAALGVGSMAAGTAMMGGYAALMAVPVYGWIAAAVIAAITAIAGAQKPSVGPLGGGNFRMQGGQAVAGTYGSDNGYPDENSKQLAEVAASSYQGFLTLSGAKFDETYSGQDSRLSNYAKDNKWRSMVNGIEKEFSNQGEAIVDLIKRSSEHYEKIGVQTLSDENVRKAIANSKAKDAENFLKDVAAGRSWSEIVKGTTAGYNPFSEQITSMMEAAKKTGEQFRDQFVDLKQRILDLGLASEKEALPKLRSVFEAQLGFGELAEPLRGMAAVIKQTEIEVETLKPTMQALGYTATQQADLIARIGQRAKDNYEQSLQTVTRPGGITVETTIDKGYRASSVDVLRQAGIDQTAQDRLPAMVSAFAGLWDAARTGAVTADQLRGAHQQLVAALRAGMIGADQYNTLLQALTQSYSEATQAAADLNGRARDVETDGLWSRVDAIRRQGAADSLINGAQALLVARHDLDEVFASVDSSRLVELRRVFAGMPEVIAAIDRAITRTSGPLRDQVLQDASAGLLQVRQQARNDYLSALQAEADGLHNAAREMRELGKSLRDLPNSLALDRELSPEAPGGRLTEARRQLNDAATRARTGDAEAMRQVQSLIPEFLRASRDYNSDAQAYRDDYSWATGLATELGGFADTLATGRDDEARTIERQITALGGTVRAIDDNTDALGSLRRATLDAADRWTRLQTQDFGDAGVADGNRIIQAAASAAGHVFTGAFRDGAFGRYAVGEQAGSGQQWGDWDTSADHMVSKMLATVSGYGGDFRDGRFVEYMKSGAVSEIQREAAREVMRRNGYVPQFAMGGFHTGGLRLVGERGPELEVTGPSRIYSAEQTRELLRSPTSSDWSPVVAAIGASTTAITTAIVSSGERVTLAIGELAAEVARLGERIADQGREIRDMTRIVQRLAVP